MPKCGLCGGEAPRLPSITEDGKCDLCGKKAKLADTPTESEKKDACQSGKDRPTCGLTPSLWQVRSKERE